MINFKWGTKKIGEYIVFVFLLVILYVVWEEGNSAPYEIKFKKLRISPPPPPTAYFSSIAGSEIPSPYLIKGREFAKKVLYLRK